MPGRSQAASGQGAAPQAPLSRLSAGASQLPSRESRAYRALGVRFQMLA